MVARILAILIFSFWLWLARDNYFHWDEWGFFTRFQDGFMATVLSWGNEHFIPINVLHHWLLFKIFGFAYLPYQISVTFFHTLNSLLLYLICKKKTNNSTLSLWMMALYGFTSIFVENVIWSLGVSVVLASTFFFLAYYFFLENKLWRSLLFLILSPLVHGITTLAPLAFIPTARKLQTKFAYLLVALVNVSLVFFVNQQKVVANLPLTWKYYLFDVPTFIATGVGIGTISRQFFPNFYFFDSLAYPAHQIRPILIPILILGLTLGGFSLLRKNFRLMVAYLPFIFVTYAAIAPARAIAGLSQAVITRYPTAPLFFLLLLTAELLTKYKIRDRSIAIASLFLVAMHVVANINFQNNHWFPIVNRDRRFVEEVKDLFVKNEIIDNSVSIKGIYSPLKLSDFWFLYPADQQLIFKEGSGERLKGDYSQKAD